MESARRLSAWLLTRAPQSYARLSGRRHCDVVIVGGGIVGLSTALFLKARGKRVIVLEAHRIAEGATGYSSAHLTTEFERSHKDLEHSFGVPTIRMLVRAREEAIDTIQRTSEKYGIECGFARCPGYLVATNDAQLRILEEEFNATKEVAPATEWLDDVPYLRGIAAIRFNAQAVFDPAAYVRGLAAHVHGDDSFVFEHSPVLAIEHGASVSVRTEMGEVTADELVLATHSPIGRSLLHTEIAPYRSYVVAARVGEAELPPGLFWDLAEPYHYVRGARMPDGTPLVVVGGADHKTGDPGRAGERGHYAAIETYAKQNLAAEEVLASWSTELFEPNDGLPFVGRAPAEKDTWVATGFGGDGLTLGTLAATVLTSELLGERHPLAELLSPRRLKPLAGGKRFIKENMSVAVHFLKDRLSSADIPSVHDLAPGHGGLVTIGGHKVAAFRDERGVLHTLSAVCTHMKCIVQWNAIERTWDCPCHGGRFAATGEVISAPPHKPLVRLDLEAKERPDEDEVRGRRTPPPTAGE